MAGVQGEAPCGKTKQTPELESVQGGRKEGGGRATARQEPGDTEGGEVE